MILVVIMLPVLLALAAMAINIAYIESVNTDIQVATDAAARAAGREFAMTSDQSKALDAAKEAVARNLIDDAVMPLSSQDLEFGNGVRNSLGEPYVFTPSGGNNGNAVRVTTRSLGAGGNPNLKPIFPVFGSVQIRPIRDAVSTQALIDLSLVVDRSGSMAYAADEQAVHPPNPSRAPIDWEFGDPVPPGARWLDLVAAVDVLIEHLNNSAQQEQLALSVYNDSPTTPQRLTSDYGTIGNSLDAISVNFEKGGTNIGGGMLEGLAALSDDAVRREFALPVMILMTDGIHNIGTSPRSAANQLHNNSVTLFVITFSDEADRNPMKAIAQQCGGEHFHAVDVQQLRDAFSEIARRLPMLLTE